MAFPETYESIIKEENINDGGYVQMEWNDTASAPIAAGTACPIDSDYLLFSTYWPSQQSAYSYCTAWHSWTICPSTSRRRP